MAEGEIPIVNKEEITTNEYGVHKQGGIVRFAIFGDYIKYSHYFEFRMK